MRSQKFRTLLPTEPVDWESGTDGEVKLILPKFSPITVVSRQSLGTVLSPTSAMLSPDFQTLSLAGTSIVTAQGEKFANMPMLGSSCLFLHNQDTCVELRGKGLEYL